MRNPLILILLILARANVRAPEPLLPDDEPRLANPALDILAIETGAQNTNQLRVVAVLRGRSQLGSATFRYVNTDGALHPDGLPPESKIIVFAYRSTPDSPYLVQGAVYADTPKNRETVMKYAASKVIGPSGRLILLGVFTVCSLAALPFFIIGRRRRAARLIAVFFALSALIVLAVYQYGLEANIRIDLWLILPLTISDILILLFSRQKRSSNHQ